VLHQIRKLRKRVDLPFRHKERQAFSSSSGGGERKEGPSSPSSSTNEKRTKTHSATREGKKKSALRKGDHLLFLSQPHIEKGDVVIKREEMGEAERRPALLGEGGKAYAFLLC